MLLGLRMYAYVLFTDLPTHDQFGHLCELTGRTLPSDSAA